MKSVFNAKAQKVIFGEMLKCSPMVKRFDVGEDSVFVTPDGYWGVVLLKQDSAFNLDRIPSVSKAPDLLGIAIQENLCKLTNHIVIHKQHGNLRKLLKDGRAIYLQMKFLQYLEAGEYYQASPNGIVVIKSGDQIVGAICPVRYEEVEQ
jgi:hypothetical protein